MVAVSLTAMIALSALAVDGGFGFITRNQLQNIADAAALAGARKLGSIYEQLTLSQQQAYTLNSTDRDAIISYMNAVATQNQAGGIAILIPDDPNVVQIGHWDGTTFAARTSHPDAVHVTARRDSTANGALQTFLAGIVGVNQFSVSASSTAALTALKQIAAGQLNCPVGVPKGYASGGSGCTNLVFSGTGACAGWHTYFETPANSNKLKTILDQLTAGTYPIPTANVGDRFNYTGGQLQSAFSNLQQLYNAKKNAQGEWNTWIVIYDIDLCSTNPHGAIPIAGFTSATITGVNDNTVSARVNCNVTQTGPGGGGTGGTDGALGTVPSLVE